MIPYGCQSINQADIDAVIKVLRSDLITQGPVVPRFEQAVAEYCGAKHSVAANSGTSALHVACLALGVEPGDMVWTSPITFVASANCARYCGADVDFVDIDPGTFNLSPQKLAEKLADTRRKGQRLPKVVIPVHFAGQSCDMAAISALSEEYGFRIIEDAAHAIGGAYREEPVGSNRFCDITVFSFHPVKVITTGEGGMAVTNDDALAECMARLCSHGITRDPHLMHGTPDGPWYYQQIELGFNYRMTDIQAALGLSQLQRLDQFVADRRRIANDYDALLGDLPVTPQAGAEDTNSAWHLYVIRLDSDRCARSHREVFGALRANNIGANLHYIPVYLQPDFRRYGYEPGYCPEAEHYYSEAITLPMFAAMTGDMQQRVVQVLQEATTDARS